MMRFDRVVSLFLLSYLVCHADAYRILLYCQAIGHSHITFQGKIADLLVEAGHQVVLLIAEYDSFSTAKTNGTKLGKVLHFTAIEDKMAWTNMMWGPTNPFQDQDMMKKENALKFWAMTDLMTDACENQITNEKLMAELRSYKFDVAMQESFDGCGSGIFHLLQIPTLISLSATPMFVMHAAALGAPSPLSYVSEVITPFGDSMTYTERLVNMVSATIFGVMASYGSRRKENNMLKKHFGPDFPDVMEIASQSSVAFINSEELLDFPRPILHKIVYIGGFAVPQPKPLTQDLSKVVDKAKTGIVLMSFGSIANLSYMPVHMHTAVFNTFAKFPDYQFIVKHENPDVQLMKRHPNVLLTKWAPQVDLLAHPKTRAFVTHGGWNSMLEAAHYGIPLVVIPLFGDQRRNSRIVTKRRIGVVVDKADITQHKFTNALTAVLQDQTYAKNAKRLKNLIAKKPTRPAELIVKWTEFAAEFGTLPELDPVGRKLNFIRYHCIDIILPPILFILIVIYAFVRILIRCLRCITQRFVGSKAKTD